MLSESMNLRITGAGLEYFRATSEGLKAVLTVRGNINHRLTRPIEPNWFFNSCATLATEKPAAH